MAKKVIYDLRNTRKKLKNVMFLGSKGGMEKIGKEAKALNLEQIEKQKEADGSRVKPYSKRYAERKGETKVTYVGKKSAAGSKRRRGGHMMFAFQVMARKGRVIVGFISKTAKQKARWNAKIRNFVGLTPKNERRLIKWVHKVFKFRG